VLIETARVGHAGDYPLPQVGSEGAWTTWRRRSWSRSALQGRSSTRGAVLQPTGPRPAARRSRRRGPGPARSTRQGSTRLRAAAWACSWAPRPRRPWRGLERLHGRGDRPPYGDHV